MPTATAPLKVVKTPDGYLNVELVRVGKWAASQGDGNVTREDIAAMAAAAQHPMADRVPIKIGHTDSRFQDADGNPPADGDGNPAYGRVENIRASEDGNTLLGDLVAMPQLLADVADSAYPDRSVEFFPGRKVGGQVYRAVLTGLALLGQSAPAVKGLNDLYAKFAAQLVQPIALHIVDDTPTIHHSQQIPADGAGDKQSHFLGGTVAVSQAVRKALELADDATDDQINEALKAAGLGVLPTADEQAAAQKATEDATAAATQKAADDAAEAGKVAASAALPAGMVAVDQVSLTDATTRLAAAEAQLSAIRTAEDKNRRDGIVALASSEGKISPLMVTHYRTLLDTDEVNTAALLAASPVLFPTREVGHAQPAQLSADGQTEFDAKLARARAAYYPKGI